MSDFMTNCFKQLRFAVWLCALGLLSARVTPVQAQERPRFMAEAAGGWIGFPDDGIVNETIVGGTFGWFVTPRLALGPELALVQGTNHCHVLLTGSLRFHFVQPQRRAVTPYLVVAGGLFQSRFEHPDATVTTRDGMAAVGAGVQAMLNRRVSVAAEARAGWESHLRVTAAIGVLLGARQR